MGNSTRIDMNDEGKVVLNMYQFDKLGLKNDSASSVMVPPGYELHLW
jgi:hypothetical protein